MREERGVVREGEERQRKKVIELKKRVKEKIRLTPNRSENTVFLDLVNKMRKGCAGGGVGGGAARGWWRETRCNV